MEQIIEYVVIACIVSGVIIGLGQGFAKIFFSWFSLFVGIVVAINFSYGLLARILPQYQSNILAIVGAGLVLFILVYLVIMNVAKMVAKMCLHLHMGGLNSLLGGFFAGVQMMIIAGLAIYWIMVAGWVNMESYPVSMFSAYWAETIILLVGSQVGFVNNLLQK